MPDLPSSENQNPLPPKTLTSEETLHQSIRQLTERVVALELSLQALVKVNDANTHVMRDCFELTEARQWMVMAVADDIALDGAPVKDSVGNVDWEHYKAKYIKFQEELQAQAAISQEAPEHPSGAVIFGGG